MFTTVVGLLALLVAVACVPIPGPGETGAVATVASQSVATPDAATSTPPATSEPPTPAATEVSTDAETPARLGENVAVLGVGRASTWSDSADLVIDGDLDTMWSAALHPVQWFSVILDDFYLVDRVEMVVAQTPAGPTTHEIWLGNGSGVRTLYERIKDVHTEDGQILEVTLDPPRAVNEVLIRTVHSPSWVAWREVRVFGQQTASPAEEAGRPRLKLKKIATGLDLPVQVTHAGDGSGRLFVVEQKGRIRIVKDGVINDTSFLDLSERISCCGERGLLGIAFPPNYAAKQHLYVSYTNVDGHTTISRYATTADPDRADPEEIVRISCCGERGLLGIAFPPNYAAKQHLYVSYTNVDGHTTISRYATTADPDRMPTRTVRKLCSLSTNRTPLTMAGVSFVVGPQDGYLYIWQRGRRSSQRSRK